VDRRWRSYNTSLAVRVVVGCDSWGGCGASGVFKWPSEVV
jgi:hypothetical protein